MTDNRAADALVAAALVPDRDAQAESVHTAHTRGRRRGAGGALMRTLLIAGTAIAAMTGVAAAQSEPEATPVSADAPVAAPDAALVAPAAPVDLLGSSIAGYAAFQEDVTALRTFQVTSADTLDRAFDQASRHNYVNVSRGWLAYGSVAAAQSPTFSQAVRDAEAYFGRAGLIQTIQRDPAFAGSLRGGDEAESLAMDAANADGERIHTVAERYREYGYSLQRFSWGRANAPRQSDRLARARQLAAPGPAPAVSDTLSPRLRVRPPAPPEVGQPALGQRGFWDAVAGQPSASAGAPSRPWRAAADSRRSVDTMTSIAALHVLGADVEQSGMIDQLLNEPLATYCFQMAQQVYFQCLSAAQKRYENAFCIGAHALGSVSECIAEMVDPTPTVAAAPPPETGAEEPAQSASAETTAPAQP